MKATRQKVYLVFTRKVGSGKGPVLEFVFSSAKKAQRHIDTDVTVQSGSYISFWIEEEVF